MEQKGITVVQMARDYGCSRIHMCRIFDKPSIDTQMQLRFSTLLHHDFFSLYSEQLAQREQTAAPPSGI